MTEATSAESLLGAHLAAQAGLFLRTLPDVRSGNLRRVGGALHTFGDLLDADWARQLEGDLAALGDVLGAEQAHGRRLVRLLASIDSLTCAEASVPGPRAEGGTGRDAVGLLAGHPGAPKARALMERQVSLARSRAHSVRLQELGSARFHALADRMTLLASDLPLRDRNREQQPAEALLPPVRATLRELADTVAELPLERAATPYNRDALHRLGGSVAPESTESDDLPWQQVWQRVLWARYALECVQPLLGVAAERPLELLRGCGDLLERQAEAATAAAAAATAARTPRITPATAYVLGVVHADQRLEVEAARHAFGVSWPELAHSGWLTDPWLARSN